MGQGDSTGRTCVLNTRAYRACCPLLPLSLLPSKTPGLTAMSRSVGLPPTVRSRSYKQHRQYHRSPPGFARQVALARLVVPPTFFDTIPYPSLSGAKATIRARATQKSMQARADRLGLDGTSVPRA
jgi:hypothetical protein